MGSRFNPKPGYLCLIPGPARTTLEGNVGHDVR